MNGFRIFMACSWVAIMASTIYAANTMGYFWPAVYFGDLLDHPWRSQFNTDFLIHLFILCSWIYWRESSRLKGAIYGFLSIFMGGMFGFAYLLHASYTARGNVSAMLLGSHYKHAGNSQT